MHMHIDLPQKSISATSARFETYESMLAQKKLGFLKK